MPTWATILLGFGVPTLGGFFAWANQRAGRRMSLIDQLQEEIAGLKEDRDKDRARIERLEYHDRIKDDYIGVLRRHINDEAGPPPPAWPAALV